jgi:DNA ligase-1
LANAVPGGKCGIPYKERFNQLKSLVENGGDNCPIELVETKIVYSIEEAYQHYFEMVGKGLEGTVVKTMEGIWRDSTSTDQAKLKVVFEVDLEILGFTAGNGKNESTFGSVTVATSDRLLIVNVSGFKDKKDPKAPHIPTRQEVWDMREQLTGTIMATKANGIMVPKNPGDVYSLFSPRFAELRMDKKTADTYAQVRAQFDAVVNPK